MRKIQTSQKFMFLLLTIVFQFPVSCKQGPNGTIEAKFSKENSSGTLKQIQEGRVIKVYYFHTTFRCSSCTKIEELTRKALTNNFTEQLKSGRIVFKAVNVEEEQNKHFIQDYQLFTKSVVLVNYIKGKQRSWQRLDKTWVYLQNPDVFEKYIKDELMTFIKN